jgi:DNA-binding response OmpR family regulator
MREQSGRVLVVDDDHAVRDVVRRYLERAGYQVDLADDGETALRSNAERRPDLIVLDLMLPGIGGLEVCRRVRERGPVPVVMLTALGEESDRVAGLELGADDYVVKPFSPRELVLRVTSVLRRATHSPPAAQESVVDGALVLDPGARRCALDGVELSLTTREFDLLAYLMRNAGRVLSRAQIMDHVWGYDAEPASNVVDIYVHYLRDKIDKDSPQPLIRTIRGVGYTIKE